MKAIIILYITTFLCSPTYAKEKLIIDTDSAYFMDDIAAIGILLNSPDKFDLRGITLAPGNLTPKNGQHYIFSLLELMDKKTIPVYLGEDWPFKNTCKKIDKFIKEFGGVDWVGACRKGDRKTPFIKSQMKASKEHAVDFLIKEIIKNPNEITVLAIGAQTNIAKAIKKSPSIAKKIKQIIIMGGDAIFHGNFDKCPSSTDSNVKTKKCGIIGGNASAMAEFNFFFDPEAARIVLESDIPEKILFGLDITNRAQVSYNEYKEITKSETPLTKLYKWEMEESYNNNKNRKLNVWDIIPAVYLLNPDIITDSEEMYITVIDQFGPAYGALYAHRVGYGKQAKNIKKVKLMKNLDYQKFYQIFKKKMTLK